MAATESGTYRVLPGPGGAEERTLLEVGTEEPIRVRADGYEDPLQATVDDLDPGNLVDATVEWPAEGTPGFAAVTVESETLFEFVDDADHVFERAERTFERGKRERSAIASTVTYGTDGDPNGALYTVAKQGGETDLFEEFRDGRKTLEPLIEKLADGGADPPHEVFVIRPLEEPFVVVFLAIDRGGLLADTIRDEYDCPRA